MAILWLRFPTDVKQSARIVPVQVQLPAGSAVANLAVVVGQTSPNVSLYTENGAIVSRTLSVPLNQFEVYLSVSTIDDHDIFVLPQPTATPPVIGIDPKARQEIAVALRETATGEATEPIYIKVAPLGAETVSSEQTLFSDDFSGTALNHDNWTASRTVAGVVAAPNQTVAASLLALNNAVVALGYTDVVSDVIEGRCHIEFRNAIESVRRADCSFILGAYFVDLESTAIVDLTNQLQGFLAFGINWRNTGYVNDPATTVEILHGQNATLVGPNTPVVLAAGGVTTTAHTLSIDFDGHAAVFSVDGTVVATVTTRIPSVASKRFIVVMSSRTTGVPAGVNRLDIDRVDVASDERLVTTGAAGGGGGGGVVVNVDLQGQVESQPAPSPSSIRGALADLALLEEPDHALRTSARVRTESDSLSDDFTGAAIETVLVGTSLFTAGSAAVVGTGTAYTTALRQGQYIILAADFDPTTPTRWGQVRSVEDDTHCTLEEVYTGAGGPAGVAWSANWVQYWTDLVGSGVTVLNSTARMRAGIVAGDSVGVRRRTAFAGRKGSSPIYASWLASLDTRRANQNARMWLVAPDPVTPIFIAGFILYGTDADNIVAVRTTGGAAGADQWQDSLTMLPGFLAVNENFYEILAHNGIVEFFVNGVRVAAHPYHLPPSYTDWYVDSHLENSGIPGGVTNFYVNQAIIESFDDVKAEVFQSNPEKLRTNAVDITPNGPALGVSTAVAVNVVVNIAATVAGKRYRVGVIGGAGVCIRVDGVDPVVTDECWFDGMRFNCIATVTSASGIRAMKRTAGTADLVVQVVPLV